jgi:hypothetical protein
MYIVKKDKISVRYSLVWLFASFATIVFASIPQLLGRIAHLLGFELISNMVLLVMIGLLMTLTLSLTIIVSQLRKKITLLVQEVSILKEKVNDK